MSFDSPSASYLQHAKRVVNYCDDGRIRTKCKGKIVFCIKETGKVVTFREHHRWDGRFCGAQDLLLHFFNIPFFQLQKLFTQLIKSIYYD